MAKWAVVLFLTVACLAVASPIYAQGSSNAAAGGAGATAAGDDTAVSAADGGASSEAASTKESASASAAVSAAAAAAGGLITLPSLGAAPATAIVQPVLPAAQQTAFTGVVVDEVVSFSEKYCTAASYDAGVENAANYTGPGMAISFTTGACKVPFSDDDVSSSNTQSASSASSSASSGRKLFQASSSGAASGKDSSASAAASNGGSSGSSGASTLNCIEPTLVVTKTPAIYTSAYHSAATFTGKECKVQPTVGEATAEVLYTFDDATPVDPLSLANLIQAKLATILQEGYQDLIKQIASSASFAPGSTGIAGGAASASSAAAGR